MSVYGVVLAAGAGSRYGMPKALVGDWLPRAVAALHNGGCDLVTVVLGAEAERARPHVPSNAGVVIAGDWAEGMGASLRAGLSAVAADAEAVVLHLVDLPDVAAPVIGRLLTTYPIGPDTLRRAAYDGRPGHPVVLGRAHLAGVAELAVGDRGARDYLRSREVTLVECGDLATGLDIDRPVEGTSDRPDPSDR